VSLEAGRSTVGTFVLELENPSLSKHKKSFSCLCHWCLSQGLETSGVRELAQGLKQ